MNRKVTHEGAINLAYGNRISLNTTIDLLKKHFPDLQVKYVETRAGDVKDSQNSPGLLKELFPNIVPTDFEHALSETVEWLREFGDTVAHGPKVSD
jgi:UDP-glucose 4-epimerase